MPINVWKQLKERIDKFIAEELNGLMTVEVQEFNEQVRNFMTNLGVPEWTARTMAYTLLFQAGGRH
jgi:hypothetical protein